MTPCCVRSFLSNMTVFAKAPASDWNPIPLVGTAVVEIRVHADGEYRVFYVAKFEDAVYCHPHSTLSWGRNVTVNCWKGGSDASDKGQ